MRIVQLMHPGKEPLLPKRPGEEFPVNCGSHWRRYLLARGEFAKPDDALSAGQPEQHEALLGFWGEWEQPTRGTRFTAGHGHGAAGFPKTWHEPLEPDPAGCGAPDAWRGSRRLGPDGGCGASGDCGDEKSGTCTKTPMPSTDPFVFVPGFYYAACQIRPGHALDRLEPGSMVVFCSQVQRRLVFDAVLVIEKRLTLAEAHQQSLLFRRCVGSSVVAKRDDEPAVYWGKPPEAGGVFSFFPAVPVNSQCEAEPPGFARPRVPDGLITVKRGRRNRFSGRMPQGYKVIEGLDRAAAWQALVKATAGVGLVLGTAASLRCGPGR